jgi:hypothetical protein
MACPYFMPVEKLESGAWPHPQRLPLGAGWKGHCTAPEHEGQFPAQEILESCCNLGYAAACVWAPLNRISDAVRFAVLPSSRVPAKKREAPSSSIRLCYVFEREHRPVEAGELEFDLTHSVWLRPHSDPRVQKMAQCFLEFHLARRS